MPACPNAMTSNEVVDSNVEQPSDKIGRVRKEADISSESSDSQEEDSQPQTNFVTAVGGSSSTYFVMQHFAVCISL